jgi:hypothetical protein
MPRNRFRIRVSIGPSATLHADLISSDAPSHFKLSPTCGVEREEVAEVIRSHVCSNGRPHGRYRSYCSWNEHFLEWGAEPDESGVEILPLYATRRRRLIFPPTMNRQLMARSALASARLHILPVRIAALLTERVLLNVSAVELHAMPCHACNHAHPFLPSQFAFQISASKAPPHPQRANTISSRRASIMMALHRSG